MTDLINTLNKNQREIFDLMNQKSRLQICLPTGVGKGYLMGVDIKYKFNMTDQVIAIASHRLILNSQHMDDVILRLKDDMKNTRMIFVGSTKYDSSKLEFDKDIFKILHKIRLNSDEIIYQTSNKGDLTTMVNDFKADNKKVVIVSTYHSLNKLSDIDIDTFYADEAHTLASNENLTAFEKNFKSISSKKSYFLTATPKDCVDSGDDSNFLMNNEEIFGERVGMSMSEAIDLGYITRPVIHTAIPMDYESQDMDNVQNKVKFIIDVYKVHTKHVKEPLDYTDEHTSLGDEDIKHAKESSFNKDLIQPKLLIKCDSVDNMWDVYDNLVRLNLSDVSIFAGASRRGKDGAYYMRDETRLNKDEHIEQLKSLKNLDRAIVLHVDTLSEGINVKGFTGVMFLTDKTPTIIKLLQNIGRGTRVLNEDRENFTKGNINTKDYKGWIKPNTYIILPIYSPESEVSQNYLSETIKKIRQSTDVETYKMSIGNDEGKGLDEALDPLVDSENSERMKKLVKEIEHNIEKLIEDDIDLNKQRELSKMTTKDKLEKYMKYE